MEEIKLDNGLTEIIDKYEKDSIVIKLVQEEKGTIGIAIVDKNAKVNNIYVEVEIEHRGNGYGKYLFNEALKECLKNFEKKELTFKTMSRNLINIIIYKAGGIHVDTDDSINTIIVPLK